MGELSHCFGNMPKSDFGCLKCTIAVECLYQTLLKNEIRGSASLPSSDETGDKA